MCRDLKPIPQTEAIVYKVVAQKLKGKRYYSIAMGFMYPQKDKVPRIKIQRRLGYYVADILTGYHIDHMVGRTAGFVDRSNAEDLRRTMRIWMASNGQLKKHSLLVVKIKLSDALMSGTYKGYDIIAGRHIEFLE